MELFPTVIILIVIGLSGCLITSLAYRIGQRVERIKLRREREKRLNVAREKMKTSTSSLSK